MRILVTSTPGIGHIHPMLPLATALRAAGHEVVWATARESCQVIERFGFRTLPAGLALGTRQELFAARALRLEDVPARQRRRLVMPLIFGEIAAPAMHDELVAVFDELQPHLVLHELAELAAAPLALARGIPHVTLGFSGALSDELASALRASVAPLWAQDGVPLTPRTFQGELLLHPFPRSMDTPRSDGPALPIGPAPVGSAFAAPAPEWVERFGVDRPGVYVTFGTESARIAPWAELFSALADLPIDVVATVGSGLDEASLGPRPANVRVAPFVPQQRLLGRAAAVVSHAGAGTLIGAAAAGCVQLHLPLHADQWDNADLLSATGAGLTMQAHERQAPRIRAAIEWLLGDTTVRTAAQGLRADFAAMPHPRDVVSAIER